MCVCSGACVHAHVDRGTAEAFDTMYVNKNMNMNNWQKGSVSISVSFFSLSIKANGGFCSVYINGFLSQRIIGQNSHTEQNFSNDGL